MKFNLICDPSHKTVTSQVLIWEQLLSCGCLPLALPQLFSLQMARQCVALSGAVRFILLSSGWPLGKVLSPGMEGSRAPSTHTCRSSTDEGLRVYTTNTAILKEKEKGVLNSGLSHVCWRVCT